MTTQNHCIACGKAFEIPILSVKGQLCKSCAGQGLFRKRLIITGITRMKHGHICVSGIDPETWRFIRPIFNTGLDRDFTMEGQSQVIRHFNLVEIELKGYRPATEVHTEDWMINEGFAPKFIRHLKDDEIIKVLDKMAVHNLAQALEPKCHSLFIVKAQKINNIWNDQWEDKFKVRMNFTDWSGVTYSDIPVTDLLTIAFVRYQLKKGNDKYAEQLMNVFNQNPFRYIRIGLTREFLGQHWKQVTALITVPDLFDGQSFSYFEGQLGMSI